MCNVHAAYLAAYTFDGYEIQRDLNPARKTEEYETALNYYPNKDQRQPMAERQKASKENCTKKNIVNDEKFLDMQQDSVFLCLLYQVICKYN